MIIRVTDPLSPPHKPPGLHMYIEWDATYRRWPWVRWLNIPPGEHPDLNGIPQRHPRFRSLLVSWRGIGYEVYYYRDDLVKGAQ